jgi:2-haloacid dehalogenase
VRDTVIFDLGGVLIDWNPRYLYRKLFDGDEAAMERFLANVCTMAWHTQHDAGAPFAETREALKQTCPGHDMLIDAFGDRHREMFRGAIDDSVALLERLAAKGTPLFAVTNWPAETFPWARQTFAFLGHFRDIAVSGVERIMKPDPRLFQLLFARNAIDPATAVYIDDSARNVEVARTLGLHGVHFRSPAQLEKELVALQLL